MARRRKIWSRTPQNRFEAWIRDTRDRYNLGLAAIALLAVLAFWYFWSGFFSPRSVAVFPEYARATQVTNGEELRQAAAASDEYFAAQVAIPGLSDHILIHVDFPEESRREVTDAQVRAFDRFLTDYPDLRQPMLERLLAVQRAVKIAYDTYMEYVRKEMSPKELLLTDASSMLNISLPDIKDIDELQRRLGVPRLRVTSREREGLAFIILESEPDWTVNPTGVLLHGNEIVFAGEHVDAFLYGLTLEPDPADAVTDENRIGDTTPEDSME